MKNSKRIISVILSIVLLMVGMTSTSYADAENESYTEVIFQANSVFTEDQKDIIRASFEEDQPAASPYGLQCLLFGHSYVTEYTTVIQHKVAATSPRCRRDIYETSVCENCSDTQSTLISWKYIDCCE